MSIVRHRTLGHFYGCTRFPLCRCTHGAHPDGSPLGAPADKRTREARIKAHEAFDWLWKLHYFGSRNEAYRWMRNAMGLSNQEAHIAKLSAEQCERLITCVEEYKSKHNSCDPEWMEPPAGFEFDPSNWW